MTEILGTMRRIDERRGAVRVEERGLPLDVLYAHGAGWQAHIEDLGRYLAGDQSNWKSRWAEFTPASQSLAPR